MSLVIPVGFAQIAYRWSLAGDPEYMISTIGMDVSELGGSVSNAANTAWEAAWVPSNFSHDWTYRGCIAYIGQDGGPPVIQETPRAITGTHATMDTTPQNVSLLVRKGTDHGGRAGRGRMFLPPFALDEGNVSVNGMLDDGFVVDTQAILAGFLVAADWVLLHDTATPGSPAPYPITNLTLDTRIATQRRRLR